MKIGVISNEPRSGKTYFSLALSHIYSRSQQTKVAYFSTGELDHVTSPLMQSQERDEAATSGVFKAMLETGTIRGDQLFGYSTRSGLDEVYIFDLFNRRNDLNKNLEFLTRTLSSIEAKMIIVEINGDPTSKENKTIIDACDVIINLFNADVNSLGKLKAYDKTLDDKMRMKVRHLCSMYDPRVLSTKKLSGLLGKGQKEIMVMEYNPSIAKLFLDGDYSVFASKVVNGTSEEFVSTRQEFLTIMQMLFDDEKRKRIKPLKDWPKH